MSINFTSSVQHGIKIYASTGLDGYSVIHDENDNKYYIRMLIDGNWEYPEWSIDGFNTIDEANAYLSGLSDNQTQANEETDHELAMKVLGLQETEPGVYKYPCDYDTSFNLEVRCVDGEYFPKASMKCEELSLNKKISDVSKLVREIERILVKYVNGNIFSHVFLDSNKSNITSSISTRELTRNLVRVKSSNMWGMAIDIKRSGDKFGNVIVQFKGKSGGPDDIYQYFDVPVRLYRRWVTAPSKGHFFWQYIRNNFKYRKLTGNKRGMLPNAIN